MLPLNVTSCGVSSAMRSTNVDISCLLFGSFADVRRADCVYCPMVTLFMSDECADTDNRVVDVLWKLVAEGLSDFFVRFSGETIGSSITRNIGHGFKVPDDDVVGHVMCLPYRWQYKASLYSVGVLQGTGTDSLLIKAKANRRSPNWIAII